MVLLEYRWNYYLGRGRVVVIGGINRVTWAVLPGCTHGNQFIAFCPIMLPLIKKMYVGWKVIVY